MTDCGATLRYPSSGLFMCLTRAWCCSCDGSTDCGAKLRYPSSGYLRWLESACGFRHGGLKPDAGLVLILRWLDGLRRFAALSILRLSAEVGIRLRLPTWRSHAFRRIGVDLAMSRRIAALRFDIHPPFIWRRLESACGFRHGDLMPSAGLVLILRWLDGLRRCAAIHPPVICGGWNPPAASDMAVSCLVGLVLGLRWLDGLRGYAALSILRLSAEVGIRLRLPTWRSHVWRGIGVDLAMA